MMKCSSDPRVTRSWRHRSPARTGFCWWGIWSLPLRGDMLGWVPSLLSRETECHFLEISQQLPTDSTPAYPLPTRASLFKPLLCLRRCLSLSLTPRGRAQDAHEGFSGGAPPGIQFPGMGMQAEATGSSSSSMTSPRAGGDGRDRGFYEGSRSGEGHWGSRCFWWVGCGRSRVLLHPPPPFA